MLNNIIKNKLKKYLNIFLFELNNIKENKINDRIEKII
jgi:hypothetical protein